MTIVAEAARHARRHRRHPLHPRRTNPRPPSHATNPPAEPAEYGGAAAPAKAVADIIAAKDDAVGCRAGFPVQGARNEPSLDAWSVAFEGELQVKQC